MLRKNNVLLTMRNFLCVCMVLAAFAACKPGIPKELIQPPEMTEILYNIHLTDGYITTIPNQDSSKKVSAAYYKGIFKKYAIDSVKYTKSMDYYYNHPEILSTMYTTITKRLEKDKVLVAKLSEKRLLAERKKKEAAAKKLHADSLSKGLIKISAKTLQQQKKLKKDSADKAKTLQKPKAGLTQKLN